MRSQGLIFRDLTKDKKAYKKFMKSKKTEIFGNLYTAIYRKLIKYFLKPYLVKMNRFERIILRILLVTVFYIDWVKNPFFQKFNFFLVLPHDHNDSDALSREVHHPYPVLGVVDLPLLHDSCFHSICPTQIYFDSKNQFYADNRNAEPVEHHEHVVLVPFHPDHCIFLFQSRQVSDFVQPYTHFLEIDGKFLDLYAEGIEQDEKIDEAVLARQ